MSTYFWPSVEITLAFPSDNEIDTFADWRMTSWTDHLIVHRCLFGFRTGPALVVCVLVPVIY